MFSIDSVFLDGQPLETSTYVAPEVVRRVVWKTSCSGSALCQGAHQTHSQVELAATGIAVAFASPIAWGPAQSLDVARQLPAGLVRT